MIEQTYKDSVIQIRILRSEKEKWNLYYREQSFASLSEFIRVCVNFMVLEVELKYKNFKKYVKSKKDSLIRFKINSNLKEKWRYYAVNNNFSSISKLIRYSMNEYIKNEYFYGRLDKEKIHHLNFDKFDNSPKNLIVFDELNHKSIEPSLKLNNITTRRFNTLDRIYDEYDECERESKALSRILVKKIPLDLINLKKTLITVSSTSNFENFFNISFACAYISKDGKKIQKSSSEFSILPPQSRGSVGAIITETLKFKLLLDILNEKDYIPDLILVDGTLSWIQEKRLSSIEPTNKIINEYFENFIEISNKLFDVLKEKNIPIVALSQIEIGKKYFNALNNHIDNEFDKLTNQDIKNLLNGENKRILKKWRLKNKSKVFLEKFLPFYIFEQSKVFYRTVALPLIKGYGLETDLIIKNLNNGNLLGLLINTSPMESLYLEIPRYFEGQIKNILKSLVGMCYNSVINGLPMSLYLNNIQLKHFNEIIRKIIPPLQKSIFMNKDRAIQSIRVVEEVNKMIEIFNKMPNINLI